MRTSSLKSTKILLPDLRRPNSESQLMAASTQKAAVTFAVDNSLHGLIANLKNNNRKGWDELREFLEMALLAKSAYPELKGDLLNFKNFFDELIDDPLTQDEILRIRSNIRPMSKIEQLFLAQLKGWQNIIDNFRFQGSAPGAGLMFSPQCIRDMVRTKKFIFAIREKLDDISKQKPNGIIEVLEAGCGSIPLMGVYAALYSERVNCTLLENDFGSFIIASQLVKDLGLQDRVKVVFTDASQYEPKASPDLVISETMNAGLIDESMTSILNNLSKYCTNTTRFIPEKVELALDAEKTPLFAAGKPGFPRDFLWTYRPGSSEGINIEHNFLPGKTLYLKTRVTLSGANILEPGQTDITSDVTVNSNRNPLCYQAGDFF